MILKKDLQEVFANYGFDASSYVNIKQIKIGHINSTYTLYFDQGSSVKRYLLQEINTHVFKNPIQLMENIEKITTFLSEKVRLSGAKNYENLSLRVIHTLDHHSYMMLEKPSEPSKICYPILMLPNYTKRFLIFTTHLIVSKPF